MYYRKYFKKEKTSPPQRLSNAQFFAKTQDAQKAIFELWKKAINEKNYSKMLQLVEKSNINTLSNAGGYYKKANNLKLKAFGFPKKLGGKIENTKKQAKKYILSKINEEKKEVVNNDEKQEVKEEVDDEKQEVKEEAKSKESLQEKITREFQDAIDSKNYEEILNLIDKAQINTLSNAGGYYKKVNKMNQKPFGSMQITKNIADMRRHAKNFFLKILGREEIVKEKDLKKESKNEEEEDNEDKDMSQFGVGGDAAFEEDEDVSFIVARPSFLDKADYPAPEEKKEAGLAIHEIKLPVELQNVVDEVIENHKDDEEFKNEYLEPIRQYFRDRGMKKTKIEEDKKEQEEDKKEEEKNAPLKDLTIMMYVSKVRSYLLQKDIWHGPKYEEQIESIKQQAYSADYEEWNKLPPAVKIRQWYKIRKKGKFGYALAGWEKALKDLDYLPDAIVRFTADSIFDNLTNRVLTYRKQRLEQRLECTVLIITQPETLLKEILNGFFTNENKGKNLFCALLLASGRRPKDIYNSGCFQPLEATELDTTPAFDRYECFAFSGLKPGLASYKRGGVIPLLVPFGLFQNGLRRFRKMWGHSKNVTTKAFSQEAYDLVFEPLLAKGIIERKHNESKFNLGSREFRAMYARYSVAIFGADKNFNLWIKSVLMHTHVATSLNYTRIIFPQDNMQRMQPWAINIPRNVLKRFLNTKLQEAKFLGRESVSEPFKETFFNVKCLGITLQEALSATENETVKEIIRKFWRGERLNDEEVNEVENEMDDDPEDEDYVPSDEGVTSESE
jgi:hypothetical protein